MDPKVKALHDRLNAAADEVKILYDISEAEYLLLTMILVEMIEYRFSKKLTIKLLKAATHFMEIMEESRSKNEVDKE